VILLEITEVTICFTGIAGITMAEALLRGSKFITFDFLNYRATYEGPESVLELFKKILKANCVKFSIV
jgi:hypothetical protein